MGIHIKLAELNDGLETLGERTTRFSGSTTAFLLAAGLTLLWVVTGPFFGFNDTWQLAMNTISSIVTFLMVFLIQRSQNKDGEAIQIKLDELIAATKGASNRLIDAEGLREKDLKELHEHYKKLAALAHQQQELLDSLTVERPTGKPSHEVETQPIG